MRVLFVSYDGMTDPLGRSQVLPYLTGLAKLGHRIDILSCEKPAAFAAGKAAVEEICTAAGIGWHPLPYHKHPPILSSMMDVAAMKRRADQLHREQHYDIVHCRTLMSALVGASLKARHGVRFLFDMRAFWPEERVEGGLWSLSNPVYRAVYTYFKRREAQFLRDADHVVSLTEAGRKILDGRATGGPQAPITVIPCCADFAFFQIASEAEKRSARQSLGIAEESNVLAYLGSIGTWYMLDEMLAFFRIYRTEHPDAVLLFVTHSDPATILDAAARHDVPPDALVIRAASREQVPQFMAAADAGLFFIKPVYSKQASSPTKLAELLAMGLPVITNAGVGDVDSIVTDARAGVIVDRFDDQSYRDATIALAAYKVEPERLRSEALALFDVTVGIARYDAIYRSLGRPEAPAP